MTYARKVDLNHGEIVDALRKTGWLVMDTSRLPGFCDLVCYHRGRDVLRLIEVKSPGGRETRLQLLLRQEGWPVVTVHSREDALSL